MNSTPPRHGWHQTDADRSLLAELAGRLPERIADAHAHIYRTAHLDPVPDFIEPGPADSGIEEWRAHVGTIVGGAERLDGALILPYPNRSSDTAEVNRFVVEATRGHEGIRAALLATPECDPDGIDALAEPAIGGFKVYWCYATGPGDPQQAAPSRFLPEWVWQQAHERGWFITLHLMRDAALADPVNQREVREHCERYPNARLVLAHAARGFYAPNTVAGIGSLSGLENVWFDTSAICEPEALVAILREFGPRRLLFGTDYPISHQRGRAISLGTNFAWVVTDRVERWDFPDETPAQVGIEGIRAVLTAADLMNLDERDLADIFHDNTMRLLGFQEDDPELGQRLFTRAKEFIPGGTQLQSKNPDNLGAGRVAAVLPRGARHRRLGRIRTAVSGRGPSRHRRGGARLPRSRRDARGHAARGARQLLDAQLARGDGGRRAAVRAPSLGGEGPLRPFRRRDLLDRRPHRALHHRPLTAGDLRLPRLARLVPGRQRGR